MADNIQINIDLVAKQVLSELKKINDTVGSSKKAFSGLGSTIIVANQALELTRRVISPITNALGGIISKAKEIEQIEVQFRVLTGSAGKAKTIIKDLQDFSAKTPFQLPGIASAAQQLLAFGFEAEEIIPKLQEIGDVAAGSGSDLKEVALIYGQVAAAGKLTGERLLQFQERAIPIGPAIAKTMGIAENAVRDAVSKGEVDLKTFQAAFASLSKEGEIFYEGMIKQSKTLGGVMSTLGDNFDLLASDIGELFLPMIKDAAIAIINFIQENRKLIVLKIKEFIDSISKAYESFTGFLSENAEALKTSAKAMIITGAAIGVITVALKANAIAMSIAAAATGAFTAVLAVLTSPITLIVAAIAGIGVAAYYLSKNWDFVTAKMKVFVGTVLEKISPAINFLLGIVSKVVSVFSNDFARSIDSAKEKIAEFSKGLQESGESDLERLRIAEEEKEEARQRELEALQNKANTEVEIVAEAEKKKTEIKLTELQIRLGADSDEYAKFQQRLKFKKGKWEDTEKAMLQMTQSKSNTLKSIGKTVATYNAIQNTYAAATGALASLTPIPIVGPYIAIAMAAAITAMGLENVAKINAAQQGGIVPGVGSGDKVPMMLEPGEVIIPKQIRPTFEEAYGRGRGGTTIVNNYNIQGDVLAEDSFINRMAERLSDAVENRNLRLLASEV